MPIWHPIGVCVEKGGGGMPLRPRAHLAANQCVRSSSSSDGGRGGHRCGGRVAVAVVMVVVVVTVVVAAGQYQ